MRKTPCERAHVKGFFIGGRRMGKWGRPVPGDRGSSGEERERKMKGGQDPFKRKGSECAEEVLLVAAAEDVSCEDPKGRPVQTPEY